MYRVGTETLKPCRVFLKIIQSRYLTQTKVMAAVWWKFWGGAVPHFFDWRDALLMFLVHLFSFSSRHPTSFTRLHLSFHDYTSGESFIWNTLNRVHTSWDSCVSSLNDSTLSVCRLMLPVLKMQFLYDCWSVQRCALVSFWHLLTSDSSCFVPVENVIIRDYML